VLVAVVWLAVWVGAVSGGAGSRVFSAVAWVAFAFMDRGVPAGEAVVLEVAQLEALLAKTFDLGLNVGRGKE